VVDVACDRRRRTVRPAPGFSLVETLVATLLVALAMLGLGGLQLAALRGAGTSLDLLAAAGHASSHQERVRALHDAPDDVRAALGGIGAPVGCNAERRCTPLEFAQDEASRWEAPPSVPWRPRPPELDDTRLRLEVARDDEPFVVLEVDA
jgi:type II secretory pathway pseudopilin PulG